MPDKPETRPFRKQAEALLRRAEDRAFIQPDQAIALSKIARVYVALDRNEILRESLEKRNVRMFRTFHGSHATHENGDSVQENTSSGFGGSLSAPSDRKAVPYAG